MNKWLPIVIATALGTGAFAQEAPPAADLQSQINELRQMIKAQKDELYKQKVELDTVRVAKADKSSVPKIPTLSFGDNVQGLKITGDLRERYEIRDLNSYATNPRADRLRTRLRLGAVWQVPSETWEIGVGIATGGASATSDATSTNATWSENSVFEPMTLRLDYAYAKHIWRLGETESNLISMTIGQAKNPYKSAGILWDGDVNPIGLTLQYENPTLITDKLGVFATAGAYMVGTVKDKTLANQAQMFAAETGLTYGGKDDAWRSTLAIGGFAFTDETIYGKDNKGSAIDTTGVDATTYKFMIGHVYADLTRKFANGLEVGPYGEGWMNFGASNKNGSTVFGNQYADGGNNTVGYVLGLKGKYNKFSGSLDYVCSGAYSGFWPVMDSDFGSGVTYGAGGNDCRDVRGYRVKLGYDIFKNLSLTANYMTYETNHRDPAKGTADQGQLFMFDLVYKF